MARVFYEHEVYLQITEIWSDPTSCKRDTKSTSHPGMKLAPQCEFSHVNTPYKPIGLISKSLFCKLYNMKMLNFVFYEECKQAKTNFFSLSELGWIWSLGIQLHWEGLAYIWQSKWLRIVAIKTERTQIHFLSDVLVAVASLDLKVPIDYLSKHVFKSAIVFDKR